MFPACVPFALIGRVPIYARRRRQFPSWVKKSSILAPWTFDAYGIEACPALSAIGTGQVESDDETLELVAYQKRPLQQMPFILTPRPT